MAKVPFTKAAQSPKQLLQKLRDRGLLVPPEEENTALSYLQAVGGYRLKGYWYQLIDPATNQFRNDLSFKKIINRYEFDRELRAISHAAIERLEVAIRAVMANHLSLKHSPHWFLNPAVFKPTSSWGMGQLLRKIEEEVDRSKGKRFVHHYQSKHDEPYLPPSWIISECVTFGLWSRTYSILRSPDDKKAISNKFGVNQPEVFSSWIHTLTVLRNIVAHHGQLLEVTLGVSPTNYKTKNIKFNTSKDFYSAATVINYLLIHTNLPQTWQIDLTTLFAKYPDISPQKSLGFPAAWPAIAGWQ